MAEESTNYFAELEKVATDVKKKNGLSYTSWAEAWAELKRRHPDAEYEIIQDYETGKFLHGEGFVCTTVTVNGLTHDMWLPVLDFKNKSVANPDTYAINKAIMRCLAKNIAMHGIGLHLYRGEDLPEDADETPKAKSSRKAAKKATTVTPAQKKKATAARKNKDPDAVRALYKKYESDPDKLITALEALPAV